MSIVEVNLLEDRIGDFFLILIFGHQGYKTEIACLPLCTNLTGMIDLD